MAVAHQRYQGHKDGDSGEIRFYVEIYSEKKKQVSSIL